jgi:hypothetical protein
MPFAALRKLFSPAPAAAGATQVPRAFRVRLEPLHAASLELLDGAGGRCPAQVANVSSTGLGILASSGLEWIQAGATVGARLSLGSESFDVQLQAVHKRPQSMGFRFLEPSLSAMRSAVPRYFSAELAAGRTHAVPPSVLKAHPDGEPTLIMGDNGCELFLVMRQERLARFTLSFFGNYAEGAAGSETRYGVVVEDERVGPVYRGTDLVHWGKADAEVQANMRRFVLGVAQLTHPQREALLAALS